MRVTIVLYRLCRCAERCLVSNQSVAKSLRGTIFIFILFSSFVQFIKRFKAPTTPSATDWNFSQFGPVYSELGVDIKCPSALPHLCLGF